MHTHTHKAINQDRGREMEQWICEEWWQQTYITNFENVTLQNNMIQDPFRNPILPPFITRVEELHIDLV